MISTLVIDCGGGGIKATVLDDSGTMRAQPIRVATPYPLTTKLFIKTLVDLAKKLPPSTHATVGLPGMVGRSCVLEISARGAGLNVSADLVFTRGETIFSVPVLEPGFKFERSALRSVPL